MDGSRPDRQAILAMTAGFQEACVIGAAAEMDVFHALKDQWLTASELADRLEADLRGTTILLDAVAALDLLEKQDDRYRVPAAIRPLLCPDEPDNILPMILHRMNVLRG